MDILKPNLAKTKSSNSAHARSDSRSKKSRSSAELQPKILKKRGVYVEKKTTKLKLNAETGQQVKPARPRPGKKRFLASVYTILSKSIACTQFPECDNDKIKKEPKFKHKRRQEDDSEQSQDKKRQKYKSKYVNENKNDRPKVVILEPIRDIVQTASESCNDQESTRCFNLPRLVKPDSEMETRTEFKGRFEDVRVDVATNVTDGRKLKQKRVGIKDNEPKTLVSDETKDNGMYNFFVDLLETTFNVYNVKPEYGMPLPSSNVSASKVDFVIDEKVAKKLNVIENTVDTPELIDDITPVKQQYFIKNETNYHYGKVTDIPTIPLFPKWTGNSKKIKSKSFAGNGSPLSLPRASLLNRSGKKNKKKELLLNILKDELSMDYNDFEEPQNLFQALQVIARNKRKCKKTIRFDKSAIKTDNDSGDPKCIFKRRNIMSINNKSNKKNRDSSQIKSTRSFSQKDSDISKNYNYRKKYKQTELANDVDSHHTLEVYGVEYDNPFARQSNGPEDIFLPYHSSSSIDELDFNSNETILHFSDSGTSNFNFHATDRNVLKLN